MECGFEYSAAEDDGASIALMVDALLYFVHVCFDFIFDVVGHANCMLHRDAQACEFIEQLYFFSDVVRFVQFLCEFRSFCVLCIFE